MHRTGRSAVGAAILAVVACNVYDPTILVGGGDSSGSGNVGAAGGKGGKSGAAGGAGIGGIQAGGIGGRGSAGASVGGMGVAGASASPGGAGGIAGMENLGGQGAEGGQAGTGDGGEDMGGSGGDAGTGGAGRGGAGRGGAGGAGAGGTSGRGGTSGAGGTSGVGGSAGTGGSAGKAGSSGTGGAGSGGTAGGGGSGGSPTVANGCARLSVPLDDTDDRAHFVISLASNANFSAAVITMRVYAAAATGGSIRNYVQDGTTFRFLGNSVRPAFTAGWQTITWDVGAQDPGTSMIDKASIKRIGIEVNAEPSSAWASGATVLFVDSVTVTAPTESFTFGTTGTVVTATDLESDQSGEVLWLNSYSSDTTATGVAVSWVATCP
jgi:hypothetical protein